MIGSRDIILVTVLGAMAACGCDRSEPAPVVRPAASTTAPTTAPATTEADVPDTQPANAFINVGGHSTVFPAARLRVERNDDGKLAVTLYSDDPREALRDNYTGNSFYLRMDLDVADLADVDQAQWQFKATSSARTEDSPYGIFLAGHNTQLQPYDVQAKFRKEAGGAVTVLMAGQFQVVDANNGPPKMVPVAGELKARVDKASPKKR